MKLYLDIDGVLITAKKPHAPEGLRYSWSI